MEDPPITGWSQKTSRSTNSDIHHSDIQNLGQFDIFLGNI